MAGQPEACNLQRGHRHGVAGGRVLHGYVYGQHGECAGEPLRIGFLGRGGPGQPVLFHYPAVGMDEHPHYADLFHLPTFPSID